MTKSEKLANIILSNIRNINEVPNMYGCTTEPSHASYHQVQYSFIDEDGYIQKFFVSHSRNYKSRIRLLELFHIDTPNNIDHVM